MRSSFFGLNIAVRGLYAAQRNLDIVNHNLNNITTPGYSRQQGVQQAGRPMAIYDGTGMVGTGSEVIATNRIRDEFLDYKYWSENKANGEWDAKQEMLADIEAAFNEPSQEGEAGSGFTKIMNDFYNSLQELSKSPSDLSLRAVVRQAGVTLTKYFNNAASHFEKLQQDLNDRIKTKVVEVNTLAKQISELNRQIYTSELDGSSANDLRDKRSLLVDSLSKLVNIQANEVVVGKLPNGKDNIHFQVTISGKPLVDHRDVTELKVEKRDTAKNEKVNDEDVDGLYNISWEDNNKVEIKSGELRGYLDVRDGNDGVIGTSGLQNPKYKGIPYYMRKLNEFVRTFAEKFDNGMNPGEGHFNGFGLNGATRHNFFTMVYKDTLLDTSTFNNNYSEMTAKNFAVSSDIMESVDNIAASDASGGQVENAKILQSLIDMRHEGIFTEGEPEEFMKALIVNVGIDSQQAQRLYENQNNIVKMVEKQRISVSGVSEDEEMTNLVKFQQTYNACAKMITTMAEVYDTLINKMGVIG